MLELEILGRRTGELAECSELDMMQQVKKNNIASPTKACSNYYLIIIRAIFF